MQAEAAMKNGLEMAEMAAAATKLCNTAALQASNETDRIRVLEKLTSALENILPTYA